MIRPLKEEWWLDASALPDLYWARLSVFSETCVEVFDLDGRYKYFDREGDAVAWLQEDEYERLGALVGEGRVESSVMSPAAPTDEELMPRMILRRR